MNFEESTRTETTPIEPDWKLLYFDLALRIMDCEIGIAQGIDPRKAIETVSFIIKRRQDALTNQPMIIHEPT